MKTFIIVFFMLVVAFGLYCGVKGNFQLCDDPQVCDAI